MMIIKKITNSRALYIVLACVLSVILWLYVVSYANTDMEREFAGLEINYIGGDDILIDRNLLVTEKDLQSVSLTVLGKRSVVSSIKKDEVTVSVDLTDIRSTGVYEKVYTVTFPESIKEDSLIIVRRSPEFVTVNIDKLMTKSVEVRGDFEGSVADGYMLEPITYEPAVIQVSGPEEIVSHISCAHVVLDRENLTRTVTGMVSYTLLDYEDKEVDLQELSVDSTYVQYTIPIVMVKDVVLTVELIEGGGAGEADAVVEISPRVLTLTGASELLQSINQISLDTIDLASFAQSYTATYPIPLPNGAVNLSGDKEAKVTVSIRGLTTKSLIVTNFVFVNVTEGYRPIPITQYKDVVVRGPAEVLENVDAGDIQLVADLSQIDNAVGWFSVPATVYITGYSDVGVISGDYNLVVSLVEESEEPPSEEETEEENEEQEAEEGTE